MCDELETRLRRIAADLRAGETSPRITVRQFIALIGAKGRGYKKVNVLRGALARHGLKTLPDFVSADIDSPVAFVSTSDGRGVTPADAGTRVAIEVPAGHACGRGSGGGAAPSSGTSADVRAVPESEDTWVAIDFETATGSHDSACALGVAVIENGRVVSSGSWLIKPPGNDFSSWNIRVHGIRPEDTSFSPDYADLFPSIRDLLEERFVLAHWASFDMSVLRSVHAYYGIPLPNLRYACSCLMARRAFPALPNHKLPTVCDHCGIVLEHHHDAAEDAVACAEVALHCRRTTGTRSLHEAVQLLVDGPRRL